MFKVQQDVPIPAAIQPERPHKYPFESLAVGEFFFIPHRERNNMASQAWAQGRKLDREFSTRLLFMRETKQGWVICDGVHSAAVLGIGIWRTG